MYTVNYIFIDNTKNDNKIKIIDHTLKLLSLHLTFPKTFTIEFRNLGPGSYGETKLHHKSTRVIILNDLLNEKEILYTLIHELIHLDQLEKGQLDVYKNGDVYWEGKRYNKETIKNCDYKNYLKLPWEQDVLQKQKKLFKILLS